MPKFKFQANGLTFEGGDRPGENVTVSGPLLQAGYKASGVFQTRPALAQMVLTRSLPEKSGDLVLLMAAVASQVWDNRDRQDSNWPTCTVTYDKSEGDRPRDVQRCDLKRLMVTRWSLTWEGTGPDRRQGAGFKETVAVQALKVTRTTLVGESQSVSVELDS
jgi:hypothetical protein